MKVASTTARIVMVGMSVLLVVAFLLWLNPRNHTMRIARVRIPDEDVVPPAAAKKAWTWTDARGVKRTRSELAEFVKNIKYTAGPDLRGADLRGADLHGEYLSPTNFNSANLSGADLSGVDLSGVDLRNAELIKADLRGANLEEADLSRADLSEANLTKADLSQAIFEPKVNPESWSIAASKGLSSISWTDNSRPIFMLRKSFMDEGFREAARELTVAIHRHNQSLFEELLFDWTCEWGTNWLRPLELVGLLSLTCTMIYWIGMHFAKRSGLYLAATGQRIKTDKGRERVFKISVRYSEPTLPATQRELDFAQKARLRFVSLRRTLRMQLRALRTAFLFSLMSVFNIGFREFNFGRWIRMMQPREFDIRARGWMRTVSGIQSLLGVALTAFSLLSYFGHPFD